MKKNKKTGPKEERVKIETNWEAAVEKALEKKRLKNGWPKQKEEKEKNQKN